MEQKIKIAILTSGGDAPGMNNLLYRICDSAISNNINPYVVINGFKGLVDNDIRPANLKILKNNCHNAGSIIYCSRFKEFQQKENYFKAINNLKSNNIDYLLVLGGNGSYSGAKLLAQNGIKVICIPCTIDNDINFTEYTIGFTSALDTIVKNIQTLRFNAKSHGNVYLIEIMGRKCSDLTIASALASDIDYIITQNNIKSKDEILNIVKELKINKREILILITENIYSNNQLHEISNYVENNTNISTKVHVLGFIQRGAQPTGLELYNSTRISYYAIDCILNNHFNIALCLNTNKITHINLLENDFYKNDNIDCIKKLILKINKNY